MLNIEVIVKHIKQVHPNEHVINFYKAKLEEYAKIIPEIHVTFENEIVATCLYLLYISNQIQNDLISEKITGEDRSMAVIAEYTFFSLVQPLLGAYITDKAIVFDVFNVINDYYMLVNSNTGCDFSIQKISNEVKKVIK
ncbi:hypothetical protein COBT_002588 [Conglomerata obtusa]